MKSHCIRALLIGCVSLPLLSLTACTASIGGQYIKTDAQGQLTRLHRSFHYQGLDYQVSAKLSGALTLDTTGNNIIALPENSSISINSKDGSISFVLEHLHSDTKRTLTINGKVTDDNAQSRQHIEQLSLILFRNTPIDTKGRVTTLLAYQGADKVLAEIGLITDQETKKFYITELAQQAALTEQQHLQLLQSTDTIESDYDLTELLLSQAAIIPRQPALQNAMLQAGLGIGSDYEKRRLLSQLVQPQSGFNLSAVVQASQDIESDYELGQLLQQSAPQVRDDETLNAVLAAAKTMSSSYELQQALNTLPFEHFTTAQNERVIAVAAATIESDYELASLLTELLRRSPEPQALQKAVTAALKTISSDSDKVRVFELYYSK